MAHTTCLRVYIVTQKITLIKQQIEDNAVVSFKQKHFNKFTITTVQEIGSHFWIDEYEYVYA